MSRYKVEAKKRYIRNGIMPKGIDVCNMIEAPTILKRSSFCSFTIIVEKGGRELVFYIKKVKCYHVFSSVDEYVYVFVWVCVKCMWLWLKCLCSFRLAKMEKWRPCRAANYIYNIYHLQMDSLLKERFSLQNGP